MTAMSFQKGTVQSCSEKSILEISEIPSKVSSEKKVFFSQTSTKSYIFQT